MFSIPNDALARAKTIAYQSGARGEDSETLLRQIAEISPAFADDASVMDLLSFQHKKGRSAGEKSANPKNEEYCRKYSFDPKSKVYYNARFQSFAVSASSPGDDRRVHPNALPSLPPSARWTVLIDETGNQFDEEASSARQKLGRIVGIFIPQENEYRLPPLSENWHAVLQDYEYVERAVDRLLRSGCGVLGVSIDTLNAINGDRWFYGVETLLTLGLRLLPCDAPTTVDVRVERRGEFQNDDFWNKYLQVRLNDLQAELARSFPQKAQKITLTGRFIAKSEDRRNGYADAAAFVWGSGSVVGLLAKSGWPNACFLEGDAQKLRSAFDLTQRSERLAPIDWANLVDSEAATQSNSFVAATLRDLGEKTKQDLALWRDYLNYTTSIVDSKAIRLQSLRSQIDWLKQYAPQTDLPPKLELVWLTNQIATENHRGAGATQETVEKYKRCQKLAKNLYNEDAELACNAALHIAVSASNAFDFQQPKKILATWAQRDPAIAGLRMHGQILSSLGQFEALNGDATKAIGYFKQAIEVFKKLSDPFESEREISQTAAYLFIAATDLRPFSAQEFKTAASLYFQTPNLQEAAKKLRGTNAASEKYRCAALLRALVYLNNDPKVKADNPTIKYEIEEAATVYLRQSSAWQTDVGHPWELVEFYRGVLSSDEERDGSFRNAYQIACDEGGTALRVIAAVILGSILTLPSANRQDRDEYEKLIDQLEREIPRLAQPSSPSCKRSRLSFLQTQPTAPLPPLELAKAVLPFYFR